MKDIFDYNQLGSEIPIMVSSDLSSKFNIDSIIKSKTLKNNKMESMDFKIVSVLDDDTVFWNYKNGGQPSLNIIKNTIIIPFDKKYFYDDGINFTMKAQHTIVSVKEKEDIEEFKSYFNELSNKDGKSKYIETNELIEKICAENKPWIMILLSLAVLLTILSVIGFVGILISYITFRRREYGIRFALGATSKELCKLVCGEILIALIISNIISILPTIILMYILEIDFSVSLLIKAVFPSFIFGLILLISTYLIYSKHILKKNIVELIRGN